MAAPVAKQTPESVVETLRHRLSCLKMSLEEHRRSKDMAVERVMALATEIAAMAQQVAEHEAVIASLLPGDDWDDD